MTLPFPEREAVATSIRNAEQTIAEQLAAQFVERKGVSLVIEDIVHHLDSLAAAIECGVSLPFENYVRWTVRMLGSRGIAAAFVDETLERIAAALDQRFSGVQRAIVDEICAAGRKACVASPRSEAGETQAGLELCQRLFLQAIEHGDRRAALDIVLEALRENSAVINIYFELFQNALYEVGRRWEAGRISVATEHMATATTQFVMAQIYSRMEVPRATKGNAVITGVKGELHQIGANMVADMLEANAWSVRFLGTNLPHEAIIQTVLEHHADVLGISATMLSSVPQVVDLVIKVRAECGLLRPRILVGGAAFRFAPELWREIEVEGSAEDLRTVQALFDREPQFKQ